MKRILNTILFPFYWLYDLTELFIDRKKVGPMELVFRILTLGRRKKEKNK